jgi:hypothetical protein
MKIKLNGVEIEIDAPDCDVEIDGNKLTVKPIQRAAPNQIPQPIVVPTVYPWPTYPYWYPNVIYGQSGVPINAPYITWSQPSTVTAGNICQNYNGGICDAQYQYQFNSDGPLTIVN